MNKKIIEKKPDTKAICDGIRRRIEQGSLLPGERLPAERELAEVIGVGRATVQNAYNKLRDEGYLTKRKGFGTFVSRTEENRMNFEFLSQTGNSGITAMLNNYNVSTSNKVFSQGITTERFFTHKLGIPEKSDVFFLHRVRYGDGEPLIVEYTYLPAEEFPGVDKVDFSKVSLYDYMDAKGRMPVLFNEKLMTIDAPVHEAKLLGVNAGTPLYYVEFICFDKNRKIVEYTESYARSDRFQLNFTNRV